MSERHLRPVRLEAAEHCTIVREDGSLIGGILVNLSERDSAWRPVAGWNLASELRCAWQGWDESQGLSAGSTAIARAESSSPTREELAKALSVDTLARGPVRNG